LSQESQFQESVVIEDDSNDIEAVCAEINALREECGQINELTKLEDYYSKEVIDELKHIMKPRKASFQINPATLSIDDSSISCSTLTWEGIVCLLNDRKAVILRKPLREFPSEVFLNVVEEILPEAQKLMQENSSEGLSTIKKMSKELRKIIYGESDEPRSSKKEPIARDVHSSMDLVNQD
jgi:hypothetical protein